MKKILLFAFVLILTACSAQPQVTSTLPPTNTPLPIPTETPAPTITPTSIPTLAAFSPETWAGTDQVRMDFLATIDALGYPKENITCDEKGVCFDLEGEQLGKDGVFNFAKAKAIAVEYGKPMPTPYGPATGNVRPGTPSLEVKEKVTRPLATEFRTFLISSGVISADETRLSLEHFLLVKETNSWAIKYRIESDQGDKYYFVYTNDRNEMVAVPTN